MDSTDTITTFEKYIYNIDRKLDNFEKYVRRQTLSRFLARYELFKQVLDVKGSIIECGVHYGGGVFAWAKLSSNLEPYAIHRKVIGFDTFEGFTGVSEKDFSTVSSTNPEMKQGGFSSNSDVYSELLDCRGEYDSNRFLNQYNKIELVKGDAVETMPKYIQNNSHLVVSLLFLDFDLYEPTKKALELFFPRIPKGGIIAFDEINNQNWPGETMALLDNFLSLNHLSLKKYPFDPNISYSIV